MRILSWPETPSPMRDDKSNLASYAFAKGFQDRSSRAAKHLLVYFCQLPRDRHLAVRQDLGQNCQRTPDSVWRFEGDRGMGSLPQRLEETAKLTRLARQVARKAEAGAPVAGGGESGGHGAGTGHRYHLVSGLPRRGNQTLAGVRERGRSRVGDQGYVAPLQDFQNPRYSTVLDRRSIAQHRLTQAPAQQQPACHPCVLGCDDLDLVEHPKRP